MTTTIAAPVAPSVGARARELAFEIEVGDDAAALVRVLTVLRRRGCVIVRVEFEAHDRHRPGQLTVAVRAPTGHAHCVASWLANVVDVSAVHTNMT